MGVFFCFCFAHVSLSSHWMTAHQRSWTLTPYVCVCGHRQDTLTCLCRKEATVSSQARSPWVLPCCCHHKITTTFTPQKHAHNQHFSPLNSSVLVTNVTFLVLNHLPLLPSLFFMTFMFLVSVSSTSEDFRNVGWDSFTKCTLYVYSKPLGRPGHSHISSHFDWWFTLRLSLLTSSLFLCVCWNIISLCSVTKALKMSIQSRKCNRELCSALSI